MRFIILAIVGVAVLISGVLFASGWFDDGQNGPVACTTEALLCPDGSAVGRSGAQCEFTACPDSRPSYIGVLEQTPDGFRLLMGTPEGSGASATYVMPLQVRVSNAIQDLIGRRVEVLGSFITGNTFAVDTIEKLEGNAGDPTLGTVAVGETQWINGVKITFNEMEADYRCPADAECIEAGSVVANVTLESDTDSETRNFPSDEAPYAFDSYRISIEGVEPALMSGEEIDPSAYRVTFRVVQNEE